MFKKLLSVWLCLSLSLTFPSVMFATQETVDPFAEETKLETDKDENKNKDENKEEEIETAKVTTVENKDKEEKKDEEKKDEEEEKKDNEENEENEETKTTNYTVVSGDYLRSIAARMLGDASRWTEIVELNKDKYPSLATNPNLIYPNWNLTLPGDAKTTGTSSNGNTGSTGSTGANNVSYKNNGGSLTLDTYTGGKLPQAEFIGLFGPVARDSMKLTGVPASVTLAQAILETGWGKSSIGDAKNLFGIKGTGPAGTTVVSTQECYDGTYTTIKDGFRKYNNWQESIDDHAKLLSQSSIYKSAYDAYQSNHDADEFARGIHRCGYATSPTYSDNLISLMKQYNLYEWDV